MGKRGPAPTPTPILKLRGSTLVTRRRERREVRASGAPDCPDWLDEKGRAVWDQLVPLLAPLGILSCIDQNALARYCHLWKRWVDAENFIKDRGEMYPLKDDGGRVKCFMQWPQVAIAHKLAILLTRLEAEFGMTPSARSRIQLPESGSEVHRDKGRYFDVAG